MTRPLLTRVTTGIVVVLSVAILSGCGGSTPTTGSSATTSPPPGSGDTAICQLITKATASYNAKNFGEWRLYMGQVGATADSAQYLPLKRYAEEVKRANNPSTTTTTESKGRRGVNIGGLSALGGYLGLRRVCANLPST
jgi:hypothetical protein